MKYRHLILAVCAISLAGCGRYSSGQIMRQLADVQGEGPQQFSFSNNWGLSMPRASIEPRFERARNVCLTDKSLQCKLVNASINVATGEYSGSYAMLSVQLPHEKVTIFKRSLLLPVANEGPNDVAMRSSTTRADNVDSESVEAGRKVDQLKAYLDRLTALSKRPNLTIEDTIRLETEISRVQGELNTALKVKDETDTRVARESVSVTMNELSAGPIMSALTSASDTFVQNVASVISFLIGAIPWLPILAIVIFAGRALWRFLARKKKAAGDTARQA